MTTSMPPESQLAFVLKQVMDGMAIGNSHFL